MQINKDTTVCISIALKPGNFGSTIHNAAYKALGLNFIYKPFGIEPVDLPSVVNAMKAFKIRGCGVSMPYKIDIMKYLDKIDEKAKKIGAVSTIVNTDGILEGYNTDYDGAKIALEKMFNPKGKTVLIVGAGGVGRAISLAVKELGASKIYVADRTLEKAELLAKEFGLNPIKLEDVKNMKVDLFVNATPVGMNPDTKKMVIDVSLLSNFSALLDVVTAPPETLLMREAKKKGLKVIPGYLMALCHAAKQFELYTGKKAPLDVMKNSLRDLLGIKNW
jgi:shikimate dehydrogenase